MNGLIVIDKPAGMTSHDVVGRLRKITGERSIGHLGTLDPMATGVLPLLLGKFTRLAQYFSSAEKSYTGTIRFGFSTDTFDAEGTPDGPDLFQSLTLEEVRAAGSQFQGTIDQMPPPYSAKKIAGTPAYKLAREGKKVELKSVPVTISNFQVLEVIGAEASFEMSISAGGYVRSVAHLMGKSIGTGAHLSRLRRTQAGVFTLDQAHTLDELAECTENIELKFIHPRRLLTEMPAVTGDSHALGRLRNGAQANLPEFSQTSMVKVFAGQGELVGIARRIAGTLFQPIVVMG